MTFVQITHSIILIIRGNFFPRINFKSTLIWGVNKSILAHLELNL